MKLVIITTERKPYLARKKKRVNIKIEEKNHHKNKSSKNKEKGGAPPT
jgi:hypothetical protein